MPASEPRCLQGAEPGVRGHKGRRCEVPAASPGCRGEPRPLRSATKTEPGSEQRAGEHRGEGRGGKRVASPDPESP